MAIGSNTLVEIITYFIGTPQDDMQSLLLYFTACIIYVLLVFSVVHLFKVIGSSFRRD